MGNLRLPATIGSGGSKRCSASCLRAAIGKLKEAPRVPTDTLALRAELVSLHGFLKDADGAFPLAEPHVHTGSPKRLRS